MIYWDNNATTPVSEEVLDAMLPYLKERFMNPSSGYAGAREARQAIEEARGHVAALAGASPDEIMFTSGATESINAALSGMQAMAAKKEILCLPTDHSAVLQPLQGDALPCPVDREGSADAREWSRLAAGKPAGATFTWGNNETGVIQPAAELVRLAHGYGLPVHIDAVQCLGKIPMDIHATEAEYASFSAHKLHGPKGTGALYVRSGVRLPAFISGGDQEHGLRGGTENVPGIVGFGAAAKAALRDLGESIAAMKEKCDRFEQGLLSSLSGVKVLSAGSDRLPNTSNILFDGCTAQALFLLLEPAGLLCSAGSACKTASPNPSHVLTAMGLSDSEARSCLRFSLSSWTTGEDVAEALRLVIDAVNRVRSVQSSKTGPVTMYRP